jgi:hypothetical protein
MMVHDGAPSFVLGTPADLTDLRALEGHVRELSAALESVCHARSVGMASALFVAPGELGALITVIVP